MPMPTGGLITQKFRYVSLQNNNNKKYRGV